MPRSSRPGRRAVTPYARRRARDLGLELDDVDPAPDGVVRAAQVEAHAGSAPPAAAGRRDGAAPAAPVAAAPAAAAPEAAPDQARRPAAERSAAMRQAIANLMARSKREIPHYYLQSTIDLSTAMTWLARRNADRPVADRMIPAALLLKAAALSVAEVPDLNGFFVDGAFTRSERVHLGVAVALRGGGLVAPAIHDADRLPLDELMAALKDLVARTRSGRLRGSEMSDPTITVTNLGEQGAELVHGVIYPPQVALVGFGRVVDRPWAVDGMLAVHPVVTATLAADHRVTDGRSGSRYLIALESWLNRPEEL